MNEIEVEFRPNEAKGVRLEIDRWGDVVIRFGEVRLHDLIERIGASAGIGEILDCIGKDKVIDHFEIVEAEDDNP